MVGRLIRKGVLRSRFYQQHSLSSSKCMCEISGIAVRLYGKRPHKEPTHLVAEKMLVYSREYIMFLHSENDTTAKSQLRKSVLNSLQMHVEIQTATRKRIIIYLEQHILLGRITSNYTQNLQLRSSPKSLSGLYSTCFSDTMKEKVVSGRKLYF